MALAGVPAIDSLPPELLETIIGFLDVRTLCTARLVCTQFRRAASRCIRSVELSIETLRSRPKTTLNNFPNLSRVTVFDVKEDDVLMLAQNHVAHAVTHLRADQCLRPVPRYTQNTPDLPLLPLPNLTSLTVGYLVGPAFRFPQTLRELCLGSWAVVVTGLTNPTCLDIEVYILPESCEAVTALTALQKLDIHSELSIIPLMAELTLLSHLQFHAKWRPGPGTQSCLASLTLLHRLVHLGVTNWECGQVAASMERQVLASMATFTSLRSLDLTLCQWREQSAFETVAMTPFSQLTALKLGSYELDVSFLHRFSLERLQYLSLSEGLQLNQAGVVALGQATGLAHLELWNVDTSVKKEVATTLSRMSGLCALSLSTTKAFPATVCSNAIGLLTELTWY